MDETGTGPDEARLAAAVFLADALGLVGDPSELAAELVPVAAAGPTAAFTVEVESTGGTIPFLVSAYDLTADRAAGPAGADELSEAVATMREAARLGAPGPRLLAQAELGRWGLLLATTPDHLERLQGAAGGSAGGTAGASGDATASERAETASALLAALREVGRLAAAYQALGGRPGRGGTPEEAELALYLADGRSLQPLLALVRRVVAEAAGGEGDV